MLLLPEDVSRLESLGYSVEEFAEPLDNGFLRLKNTEKGHCVFLDTRTGRCRVYELRPLGCSFYPIVVDPQTLEPHVDPLCPLHATTRKSELRKARRLAFAFKDLAQRLRELSRS